MKIKYYIVIIGLLYWSCGGSERAVITSKEPDKENEVQPALKETANMQSNSSNQGDAKLKSAKTGLNNIEEISMIEKRNESGIVTDLIFVNSMNNEVVKTLNVTENNPYNKLAVGTQVYNEGKIFYNLEDISNEVIFDKILTDLKIEEALKSQLQFSKAISKQRVYSISDYVIIEYYLSVYNKGGGGAFIDRTTIDIYNKDGEKIYSVPDNYEGYRGISITNNGRYLVINYGGIAPENDLSQYPAPGFKIVDIKKNKTIYKKTSSNLSEAWCLDHIIIFAERLADNSFRSNVVDPDKGKIYTKDFTREEEINGINYQSDGVIYKDNNIPKKILYVNDFIINDLN